MITKARIALREPGTSESKGYFSARLKHDLHNEPAAYGKPSRLLAVSDIGGNFKAFRNLLIINKVIDNKYQWIFEDGHLVIVGDCFDKEEQMTECLWFVYALEDKAIKKGGYVHFILGNHEIMNLNGNWRYVHPKYADTIPSKDKYAVLYDRNNELWRWLQTKNILEKIGDILFVHGGISQEINQMNLSIAEINKLARPFYTSAKESHADTRLKTILNSRNSPLWFRRYYKDAVGEELIDTTLYRFEVSTIVTGHTPVKHVKPFFNNKVINIDTHHASGHSEALLIEDDLFYRVNGKGEKERIK